MNEWGFGAEVKGWWDGVFAANPAWQLVRAEVEKPEEGTQRRSDLVVYKGSDVVLAGELRLPDHLNPSPWDSKNMQGAVSKAISAGARWAFTSDGAELLLIDVQRPGPPRERVVQLNASPLCSFTSRADLDDPQVLDEVRQSWSDLMLTVGPIIAGLETPGVVPADEVFVTSLRRLLARPVAAIRDAINARRATDPVFELALVEWMVDEQGWAHDQTKWLEEIRRVAELTAYIFTTRIMFYMALRRARSNALANLVIPATKASIVRTVVADLFQDAIQVSGDYETIFKWDRSCEYALLTDEVVSGWISVVEALGDFDLSGINYEVTGKLFERLIDPHERYEWGQHYTEANVVDLMLSIAMPDGQGAILDPAVGGGTFLVRAYLRKKIVRPDATHQQLLKELFGVDTSGFAASLATISMAVRDLAAADNYPRIAAKSFFAMRPGDTFMKLPQGAGDPTSLIDVKMPACRAVVSNPPYVKASLIGTERRRETADAMLSSRTGSLATPTDPAGKPNYHVYFWWHGAQFLQDDGRLVFIASGEWLDHDYGKSLRDWLGRHFKIELVCESLAEPWFTEARVGTVVLAAQRCDSESEREANSVRFVTLRRPLMHLYGHAQDEADHLRRVDALRDKILTLTGSGESNDYDWITLTQKDLMDGKTQAAP